MAEPVDIRAEIERILAEGAAEAKAAIDASVERARALLSGHVVASRPPAIEPEWISLEQAAGIRGVSRETMARHAERFGLGTCTGRRWRIDRNRLYALNEGRPYEPLKTTPDEQNPTTLHTETD